MATTQQPAPTTVTQWRIDPTHSNVEFAVKHMMITTVRGRFNEVDGTVQYDEKVPGHSSLEVSIKTASIDTRTPDRDAHLRSPDFFDVEKYPTMTFRSTRVQDSGSQKLRIEGDLAIRGVTKPVVLDVAEEGRAKDPWGGDRAGFTATTTIDRHDFGLTWNKALEHGGWLVGQEIKVNLDIQLVRQS